MLDKAKNDIRKTEVFCFDPELIVEITSVCDLNCPGCYSPTLRTTEKPEITLAQHPDMFMQPAALAKALSNLNPTPRSLSLRGGEPSRHPLLADLIRVSADVCETVWVETHARWLAVNDDRRRDWIQTFKQTNAIVKVSFDKMHHLRTDILRDITDVLEAEDLRWMIAITEPDQASFQKTRNRCDWVEDHRITFQEFVTDHRLLVSPPLGTLSVAGRLQTQPTSHFE
ncbi:4Fe-4S cluster-binding domain-containing protein [Parasulfitobacter algicola]|uniref:4Fe-4S cluster-binding domain-containing protein n=1 Tax=Parasulfitobacter algicola TaxID=2614809 RepID=A0ABX2IXL7_9RHOB|nr:4Fe-4S cluster-binding domain-containing protein [Sulfitobacter algicola]NSX55807.1 4Fe-4S cluster-binding domain-containing protein [Sulfitobacter algicola]